MYEAIEHWNQYKKKKKFNTNFMLVNKIKSDSSSKLVSEYAKEEYDEWMTKLIAKNGVTNY